MKRLLGSLASMSLCLTFVQADCSTPTPPVQHCATTAESVTYEAAGSCGAKGVITIMVPTPGECAISVVENQAVQLPSTGVFTGTAGTTDYDLSKGNWKLEPVPSGMMGGGAGLYCTATPDTATEITLNCDITACTIVGDDDEPTCAPAGGCTTHLTVAPPGAKPDLDAGDGTDAEDADTSGPRDAAPG